MFKQFLNNSPLLRKQRQKAIKRKPEKYQRTYKKVRNIEGKCHLYVRIKHTYWNVYNATHMSKIMKGQTRLFKANQGHV